MREYSRVTGTKLDPLGPEPKLSGSGQRDREIAFVVLGIAATGLVAYKLAKLLIKLHAVDKPASPIHYIQSTLVISTSVIWNNCLSRRENPVLVLKQKPIIRLQNILEKRRNCSWGAISPLFHNIFNVYF